MTMRYKWHFAAAFISAVIAASFFLWIPRLLGNGVDQAWTLIRDPGADQGHVQSLLLRSAVLIIVASLLRGIFAFLLAFLGETLGQRVTADLRRQYYDKLQTLSFSFHDRVHSGNLMSRGLSDIEGVRMFVQSGLVRPINMLVFLGGSAAFMISLNWRLALLTLLFVPIVAARTSIMRLRLRVIWRKIQAVLGQLTTHMQENLAGVRVVRAFSAQDYEEEKFDRAAKEALRLRLAAVRVWAANSNLMSASVLLAWAVIIWYGGGLVIDGKLRVGELTQFLAYMALLQMPVRQIRMLVNAIARAQSAGGRVFEILDQVPEIRDRPNAQPLKVSRGVVRFENVTFHYNGTARALDRVSFEARPGHTIGIVGPPGSGKSTIAQLIPRFYDVDSGRVTIDGQDVRDVTVESLRQAVGIVPQDPFMFDATIRENVAYGKPDAPLERVEEAAKAAQINEYLMTLPDKYDTEVGERGVALSGGQRQRAAIARSLLTDPAVLIFDDSTSSVDAGTEHRIRMALAARYGERTTIVIAHRLSSLQHADEILVLDRGRVVERGSHRQLISIDGQYRQLWNLQRHTGEGSVDTATTTPASSGSRP